MSTLPVALRIERDALIAEIYAAFDDVSREGGVSWSEADVIDAYGSDEQCAEARESDTDRNWTELIDVEAWTGGIHYCSNWSFLDPVGFRYYLPAGLIQSLRDECCDDVTFLFHLTPIETKKPPGFRVDSDQRARWELLTVRQRSCVARYLRFIIAWQELPRTGDTSWDVRCAEEPRRAYEQYWKQFD